MEKTIFEKIIDGEIPSYKIYEDEHVYSFLDVFPITKGHTLVTVSYTHLTLPTNREV